MNMRESIDVVISDEFDRSLKKTMDLLNFLSKKIKSDPNNSDFIQIYNSVVSIARSQLDLKVAVSDAYFGSELKSYSILKSKHEEQNLRYLSEQVKESRIK